MSSTMIFLKLYCAGKLVPGEGTLLGFEDQIEVDSFTWSLEAEHKETAATKKVNVEIRPKRVSVSKVFDRATPNLCQAMAKRTPVSTARLTMVSMMLGGSKSDKNLVMMEMVLTDGFVEDVSMNAADAGKALGVKETVTLSFRKCKLLYYPSDRARNARGAATTFDLEQPSIGKG